VGEGLNAAERRRIVSAGYDALAPRWREWTSGVEGDPWERFVGELSARLPAGARVLDLGCGDGAKTRRLSERFDVVAVDLSPEQLRRARAAAPGASFLEADIVDLDFDSESVDAVTAFYSFMHVPRTEQPRLLARIAHWLRPGGLLVAPMSTLGGPDRVHDWLGVEMFFSGYDADTNRRLVRDAGFELLVDEVVCIREPERGEVTFLWVLARKPT
jgi:SAM-dependent methyltransferase